MKKLLAMFLAAGTLFAATGCGGGGKTALNVYNWNDYIGEGVIKAFEQKYPDVKVNYELFDSNESLYNKIANSRSSYDVIFPSDYMVERMIAEGRLEKINLENIPNYANIKDSFKNLAFDPDNAYSVPYTWGTLGILYNKTMVDEQDVTWETLWNEKYAGKVLMYDSMRDTMGAALKMLGYSLNTTDEAQLTEAMNKLIEQRDIVLAYVLDEVRDKMIAGEAALALVYSGDASLCVAENEDLAYAVPEQGSNIFYDCMCIPKGSPNKELAEQFINFMSEGEIARKNAEMGYCMPHSAVYDDVAFRDRYALYPDEKTIEKCEVFTDLGTAANALYAKLWTKIKASL